MRGAAMTTTTVRRLVVWIPVLMVASLLYWTVALGLGGMSLMAVSALSQDTGPLRLDLSSTGGETDTAEPTSPRDGYDPIVVRLEESVEPEDVDDNPGCGLSGGASAPSDADGTAAPSGQSGVGVY